MSNNMRWSSANTSLCTVGQRQQHKGNMYAWLNELATAYEMPVRARREIISLEKTFEITYSDER